MILFYFNYICDINIVLLEDKKGLNDKIVYTN